MKEESQEESIDLDYRWLNFVPIIGGLSVILFILLMLSEVGLITYAIFGSK